MIAGSISAGALHGPRQSQEDRYLILEPCCETGGGTLLAVMDGHGGEATADRCEELLVELIERSTHEHALDELTRVIVAIGEQVSALRSGSTLSVVWILPRSDVALWAVVGDSPIVILDSDGVAFVGPEHNVRTNAGERELAVSRGGLYEGGYICNPANGLGLQMSRALGDADMGMVIDRTPECGSVQRPRSILVASDGVLDPAHLDVASFDAAVAELRRGDSAHDFLADADERGLRDNATAVVWHAQEE